MGSQGQLVSCIIVVETSTDNLWLYLQHYYSEKKSPPLSINMPPLSGKMCWARQLSFHLEKPMKHFQAHPTLLKSGPGAALVRKYNHIALALTEYEIVHYKAWLQMVEDAQHCLHVSYTTDASTSLQLLYNV